ncbi:MAG: hypothetical protein QNJ32_08845 [Xenococcaceae cyanobacterium MO_167.B27]|nr:hypothetical protein [Xenococcaceae cyanobacterium MO_167.B27]
MPKSQTISLRLSSELLPQAEEIAGSAENLHDFLVSAIAREIQRRKSPAKKTSFWEEVAKLRTEIQQEGIEIDTEEIWGDVRDKELGRDVIL